MSGSERSIAVGDTVVSALWRRPRVARAVLVLAHGAGAGMRHAFMAALVEALAAEKIATLRYQFPYMEAGRRSPDRAPRLLAAVRAAVAAGRQLARGLPLFAGGKSMGGRMTSRAAAAEPLSSVAGLVFFSFPLHPPKKPGIERAAHLSEVEHSMLFLQGTRDPLAGLDLMEPVCRRLGRRAVLHRVEGADHGFAVLKRSGRTAGEVIAELASTTRGWMDQIAR